MVAPGWVAPDVFLAGYGAAQAMPGPLFSLAAYLGAVAEPAPNGIAGPVIALVAIFLPGSCRPPACCRFGICSAAARFASDDARNECRSRRGSSGAALYNPVWTSAATGPR